MHALGTASGNLPAALTTFVGRRQDIAEIRRRLGAKRLLTLTGVGGVGKTRLALEAAAAVRKDFPDGVWLVDLAGVQDPSAVACTVAASLGVSDMGALPDLDQLAKYLAARRTLIVLDNCEHVVGACANLANALLKAAPQLHVLATSRCALGIGGEHVATVLPLSVSDEAVELLRDRVDAVRPGFAINDVNRETLTRLCARLDGLPLAIELAATRLRTLTADQLVERLKDRFALLTGGGITTTPRQRTLRALVDWSYELCSPAERLLWRRLSIFAGGFELDAAEDVCAGEGVPRDQVLDLLDRLVDQSVVLISEHEGLPTYRMLETIRQYGRQRLSESGEELELLRRHRDFFIALAERMAADWYGPGQEESLARLRAEHGNLRMVLEYGGEGLEDAHASLVLVAALRFHWCAGGFLGEGQHQIERALRAAPEPTSARANALWVGAWVALLQGDHTIAERWLNEADDLGEQLGDSVVRAQVRGFRGMLALFRGHMEEAVSQYEGAVAALTSVSGESSALFFLLKLVLVQSLLGDPRVTATGRHAVAISEAHGERWCRSLALTMLGHDAWIRGDGKAGLALTRAGLEIQQGFNDYVSAALMLELFAWITASGGNHVRAARLLGSVQALWQDLGTDISAFAPQFAERHVTCHQSVVAALKPVGYQRALAEGSAHSTPGQAIAYALGTHTEGPSPAPDAAPLTRREREVAMLIKRGMRNRQIAVELLLSPRTVDGHVERILAKLNVESRTQIAVWVAENSPGWVPTT